MTDLEKRNIRINAIGEIYNAGFNIEDRHENTVEPMLMGGYEYIARRGSYLLAYNIADKNICLQKTDEGSIDWNGEFILKWLPFEKLEDGLLSLTIGIAIGLDYYNGL